MINSTFTNNYAKLNGGVAVSENTNVTVTNCTFNGNRAGTDGGVFYFDSEVGSLKCVYNISGSKFINNSATVNGGAIKYNYYSPDL